MTTKLKDDKGTEACAITATEEENARINAAFLVAAEREACAALCLKEAPSLDGELIADAIRARSNT